VKTSLHLVDWSGSNGLLQRAATMGWARHRDHAAPAGRVAVGRPSRGQQLRLEGSDTPSAHLISAADRQMNGSCLMKSRGLVHRCHGPGLQTMDLFHQFFNRKIIH
jgi:hypothetical protein